MTAPKPVFVASDVHLGATRPDQERAFFAWLEHAAGSASWIVLNGDLFDFWFEYRWGIPKGHDEILARLRETIAAGVPVTLMGGNHDWWGGSFLRDEVGIEFLQEPVHREIAGRSAFVAHGDGIGRGDLRYRLMRKVLRSSATRLGFGMLPPDVGGALARRVSRTEDRWDRWMEEQKQRSAALEQWATAKLTAEPELDLVLLGHTHRPVCREIAPGRWYVNSGDWVNHTSYVVLREGRAPEVVEWGRPA